MYAKETSKISIYEFRDNMMEFINQYYDKEEGMGFGFVKKCEINPFKCEINKMCRIKDDKVSYISFRMPWDVKI